MIGWWIILGIGALVALAMLYAAIDIAMEKPVKSATKREEAMAEVTISQRAAELQTAFYEAAKKSGAGHQSIHSALATATATHIRLLCATNPNVRAVEAVAPYMRSFAEFIFHWRAIVTYALMVRRVLKNNGPLPGLKTERKGFGFGGL